MVQVNTENIEKSGSGIVLAETVSGSHQNSSSQDSAWSTYLMDCGELSETETTLTEIRLEWEEIARSEVTRHRRRLSLLTPEQQTVVESALVSVAGYIFETVLQSAESYSGTERIKYMNAWRRQAA